MSLSAAEICAVLAEIRPAVLGGRIQKVSQPTDVGIVLDIRIPGQTVAVLLSVQPDTARLHIQDARLANPPQPPAFCQLLRAKIQGGTVADLRQIEDDRIVEWLILVGNSSFTLVGEFIGRGANLLLVDAQSMVLATLRPSKERLRAPLTRPSPGRPTAHHTPQSIHQRFSQDLCSADPALFPISRAIEAAYGAREVEAIRHTAQQQRQTVLRRHAKHLSRRIDALTSDLEKSHRYEQYAKYGELLKSNLGVLKKGDKEASLIDYFDEALPTLSLPLDPAKSPHANMDDYFQKYRKFLNAQREIAPRLTTARDELTRVREELHDIDSNIWTPPTRPDTQRDATGSRRTSARNSGRGTHQDGRKGPFRRFESTDGFPIYVGRNAQENEELTHRFANSDDLWLHARGMPGSHVVVRLPKGTEAPAETLRDAAMLALLYSDLKKSGKGDVIYTRKKWVKKAKGQAAGTVTVTQEKSVHIQLDRGRLEHMKERTERQQKARD